MAEEADVLIAGAGCAGLSLAVHLVEAGARARIVLVDPRTEFAKDRTWCGWNVRGHPFSAAVTHAWDRWRVTEPNGVAHVSEGAFRYEHIPADRFYAVALERLDRAPNVVLRLGERVEAIRQEGERVRAGRWTVGLAFDSRPAHRGVDPGETALVQRFVGRFVAASEDTFDPAAVDLMDFRLGADGEVGFAYVLPFDARHALVEATRVGPPSADDDVLRESVGAYLAQRWPGVRFAVEGEERGAIPMRSRSVPRSPVGNRVLPLGLAAGAAKPSTGYAFGAIQRASAETARRVAAYEAGGPLPTPPDFRSRRSEILDALFLRAVEAAPELAPHWFARMFGRVPPDALVRFLTDEGTPLDDLRVVAALPKLSFLRSTLAPRPAAPRGRLVTR